MCECGKRCGIDQCILRPSVRILFILVCCSIGFPDMAKYDVGKLMEKAKPKLVGIPPSRGKSDHDLVTIQKSRPLQKRAVHMRKEYQSYPTIFKYLFYLRTEFSRFLYRHLPELRNSCNQSFDVDWFRLHSSCLNSCLLGPCHESQITLLCDCQSSASDSRNLSISKTSLCG